MQDFIRSQIHISFQQERGKVFWTINSKRSGTMFILFSVSLLLYTLPGRATDSRNICRLNKWMLLFVDSQSTNIYLLFQKIFNDLLLCAMDCAKLQRQNGRQWPLKMVAIFPNFIQLTATCLVRKIDINTILFKGRENGTSEGLKRKEPGESGD